MGTWLDYYSRLTAITTFSNMQSDGLMGNSSILYSICYIFYDLFNTFTSRGAMFR